MTTKCARRNGDEPSEHLALIRLRTTSIHSACTQTLSIQHTQRMRIDPGGKRPTDTALFFFVSLWHHLLQRHSTVLVNAQLCDKAPLPLPHYRSILLKLAHIPHMTVEWQ